MDPSAFLQFAQAQEMPDEPKKQPVTNAEKTAWNDFIEFMKQKRLSGSPALDDRSQDMGRAAMAEYLKKNPTAPIRYERVADYQQELQNYKAELQNKMRSKQASVAGGGVVDPDAIMPGISQVDGWLGSKTSSFRFPVATATVNGAKKNYGVDVKAYDKEMSRSK